MNKFELKEILIEISDELNKLHSKLMSKSTDEETGMLRAEVIRQFVNLEDTIKEKIYNIY